MRERDDGSDSDRRCVGDFDRGVCEEDSDFAVDSSGSSAEEPFVDANVSTMQSFDDFKYTYVSSSASPHVKGHHNLDAAGTSSRTKIHPRFLSEIDNVLLGGSGPFAVLTSLTLAYSKTPRVLEELPTRGQIRSWRVTVMRSNAGTNISVEDQNKTLVLDIFEHCFKDAADLDQMSLGLIVTLRRTFYNVVASMNGQGTDVASSADGRTSSITSTAAHSFRPWVYMFVRSESEVSYVKMSEAVKKYAHVFFGRDLQLLFGSIDRRDAILNAYCFI
ncbi:hypothetical protein H257_05276 [Aphanomyces astaci]|uniref:Uncharacterized protein n=1 Tax=Aphanomyces astaci TaxID=112090 RepID=W4GRM5_APHAT|nr:hypothetical protein H257_05276 [Aphanomyces astaci]ETV81649.1 hypothetical protein H257_05276 [Aphanomyces astaci]|eukprot:XP_009828386.1 hypothetical protein H257_05276 [Aphanomyces astaci]